VTVVSEGYNGKFQRKTKEMRHKTIAMVAVVGIAVFVLTGCIAHPQPEVARAEPAKFKIDVSRFEGMGGCVIVYDSKAGKIVAVHGEKQCWQRYAPCSTFKWPLAVMAFDSGVLKDETVLLKWDGVRRSIASWNQNQTAATWMKNSVVWYSQRLTAQLGKQRLQSYLDAFDYGNRDISAGLLSAWLTVTKSDPDSRKSSLRISPFEQLEFLKKFWAGKLPVSPRAMEKTAKIVFLEISPGGYRLHGKTGSGYPDDLKGDLGWFIGQVEGHGREYLIVTLLTRNQKAADARYPGMAAKEIAKGILKDNFVW
jgi:beta-lactamase class D